MKYLRAACAVAAAAALAFPVAASAHPSVYQGEAVIDLDPGPGFTQGTQARYMVTNHNNTFVLRETNEVDVDDHKGVMSYALLPADRRALLNQTEELNTSSGAQAHHTCNVPALTSESAVLGWQGTDPFYNYVPFQKVRAGEQDPQFAAQVRGLDDTPSDWIGDVQALTGVDLTTVSNDPVQAAAQLEAMCEALPGATADSFVPADRIQTSARSLQQEMIVPLETEIAGLKTSLTAAQQARDAAQAGLNAANARLAQVMPQLTPLSVVLATARVTARRVSRNGATARVTGPPLQAVNVRLLIAKSQVKRLRLGSRVLASRRVTTAADGSANVTLKPKRKVARKLNRLRNAAAITVDAASADRATAQGTITRR